MEPKKMYFEDLDANTQEVLLDLIASYSRAQDPKKGRSRACATYGQRYIRPKSIISPS